MLDKAKRAAREKRYQDSLSPEVKAGRLMLKRLKRQLAKLCQKCPNPVVNTVCCADCRMENDARRLGGKDPRYERAALILGGTGRDRRHNGNYSKALDWSLIMHREAHIPDYTIH